MSENTSAPRGPRLSRRTTVLASTALDLLAERIQGYDGPPRVVETPYTLKVRDSTPAVPERKGS